MIFLDETVSLFTLCYEIDANQTDSCADNQSEQMIVQNNQLEYKGNPVLWLQQHCVTLNQEDFLINDDSSRQKKNICLFSFGIFFIEKCLSFVTGPEIVENKTIVEEIIDNVNATKESTESVNEENVTVTTVADFEFTTRTTRTNRLDTLEEYYDNAADEIDLENTTVVEIKEIMILTGNTSFIDDTNRTNMTVIEDIGKKKTNRT